MAFLLIQIWNILSKLIYFYYHCFRRSLPLDKLTLKPEEGIVIAFVPNFDNEGKMEDIVEAESAPQ